MVRSFAVLALVAAALMLPGVILGLGPTDSSLYNYVWTKQFAEALGRGELWPRWMPASFEGIGSPAFYFYPPLAYLVSGAVAMALPVQAAVAEAGLVFAFASGAAMYLWLRGRTPYALLGAVIYMAAPYHLIDAYVRGALAEAAAFIWLPLIALAIDRLDRRKGPALLALAYGGLILTHLPMAVLASVFLIAPLALLAGREDPARIGRAALGVGLGLMLAAAYLAPALSLRGAVHAEVLTSTHFDPRHWSPWSFAPWNAGRFRTFLVIAFGWSVLALGALRRNASWTALTLVCAACSLALVPALWGLPILREVQFPWRLLAIVEFAAVTALVLQPPKPVYLAVGSILLASSAITGMDFRGLPLAPQIDRLMTDAVEYLPAGYRPPSPLRTGLHPDLTSLRGPVVAGPVASVAQHADGSLDLQVARTGQVVVRRANFPAWRVRGPAGEAPIAPGPLIAFQAQPGSYQVLRAPLPVERLGWAISLLGLLGLAAWFAASRRRPAPSPLPASSP